MQPIRNAFIVYRSAVPVSGTALTAEWIKAKVQKLGASVNTLKLLLTTRLPCVHVHCLHYISAVLQQGQLTHLIASSFNTQLQARGPYFLSSECYSSQVVQPRLLPVAVILKRFIQSTKLQVYICGVPLLVLFLSENTFTIIKNSYLIEFV